MSPSPTAPVSSGSSFARARAKLARPLLGSLLGGVGVLIFSPYFLWWLAPLLWAGLYHLWRQTPGRRSAAGLGWSFGLGHFLAGISWVYVSMHDVGGMPSPIAALATLAFAAYLAVYPALALTLARWAAGPGRPGGFWAPLGFAGSWALGEILRGEVLTGFPWLELGVSQTPGSLLAGWAPILGGTGLSWLVTLMAAAAVEFVSMARRAPGTPHPWLTRAGLAALILLPLALALPLQNRAWTQAQGAPLQVSLLQGNIPQSMKWEPERVMDSLFRYLSLAEQHPASLIVFPETAFPLLANEIPGDVVEEMDRIAREAKATLLFGVPVEDGPDVYTNSALTRGAAGIQRYDKHHLVPFGEFIPPGFHWFLDLMHIPMSDFKAGGEAPAPLRIGEHRVAVNICYEDIFAREITPRARDADLFINLSNTAWFGDSLAQPQHLQMAQMRALETGRPMVRATNTGMTAAIDPQGRVTAALAPFTPGGLVVTVQGYTGLTPYVVWGDGLVLALALAGLAGLRLHTRRRQ